MPNPMALGFVLIFGGIVAVQLGSRPLAPAASGAPAAPAPEPDPAPARR